MADVIRFEDSRGAKFYRELENAKIEDEKEKKEFAEILLKYQDHPATRDLIKQYYENESIFNDYVAQAEKEGNRPMWTVETMMAEARWLIDVSTESARLARIICETVDKLEKRKRFTVL